MSQKAGESMKICLFNQVECLELEALLREEIKRSNVAFQQSLNHVVLERNIQEKYQILSKILLRFGESREVNKIFDKTKNFSKSVDFYIAQMLNY